MERTPVSLGLEELFDQLRSDSWQQRVVALRAVTTALADGRVDHELERSLLGHLTRAATDNKWEVKKAVAVAIGELRSIEHHRLFFLLSQIEEHPNRLVRSAVERAKANLGSRARVQRKWKDTEIDSDPIQEYLLREVNKLGLRGEVSSRVYELAMTAGNRFYRRLAAETAHKVFSDATTIKGCVQIVQEYINEQEDPTAHKHVLAAIERLERLESFVVQLRHYGDVPTGKVAKVVLLEVITRVLDETIASWKMQSSQKGNISQPVVTTCIDVSPNVVLMGYELRLERALKNVVRNSLQSSDGKDLHIRICASLESVGAVIVSVSDNGVGMTSETLAKATRRFYTTRRAKGGTGLGLAIVERVVEEHGGELKINSEYGKGTTVRMELRSL